ncbi:LLM class F420-dependent oxidoreductase [Reticulibacter mediterranei]|uniref:LLM class F420-dependent oxidoreductase n=1 Tax=Reticulibacter mediterranei TaxID=2778369 RepID=A0A8J3IWT0_9CHLR|nr:TIGR03621 family F420-dependent LLM class oxidoreductase [Reticulibacter mediterranei]GHO98262.1 LLM class F420-dependent oxidoreductase [Reticulibacter mediterranei]
MQRPFRFGILCEEMGTHEAWLTKARRAEELGYATLLVRDHFTPGSFGDQFAPIAALMAAAMATTRLRIGSMVFDNDYRHPVILSKEAATLDVLSGGRLELGLGAGWMGKEYEQAGMSFDPPGTRIARLEEALHILKGLFAPEPVMFSGKHYTITGIQGFPHPLQQPHPPILIGAGGRRMLALAAREADIVGILAGPLNAGEPTATDPDAYSAESLSRKIAWLREFAQERFSHLELSVLSSPRFTSNRLQGARQVAQERGWSSISAEDILKMPTIFIGTVDEVAEQMMERRERFGISYYMTFDRVMEAYAPLVARLAGR